MEFKWLIHWAIKMSTAEILASRDGLDKLLRSYRLTPKTRRRLAWTLGHKCETRKNTGPMPCRTGRCVS